MLTYSARNGDQHQINTQLGRARKSQFVKIGDNFFQGRYVLKKFTEKEGQNSSGITTDQSELEIYDSKTDQTFTIVRRVPHNWPDYRAEFNFTLSPDQSQFFVLQGENFTLDLEPNRSYKLLRIEENSVTIDAGEAEPTVLGLGALQLPGAQTDSSLDGL